MIDKKTLKSYTGQTGFMLWQSERDYLQHLYLYYLSQKLGNELVFKGGTCLQKSLGLNRFSEDLDFTALGTLKTSKLNLKTEFERFGYPFKISPAKRKKGNNYRIEIQGPLYMGEEHSKTTIRIEISTREKLLLPPRIFHFIPIYEDLRPYIFPIMENKEILAEKVRTIFTRSKSRDVYDLWFLLKKNIEIDYNFIDIKLQFYNKSYSKNEFIENVEQIENIWENELSQLISKPPEYNEVFNYIKLKFS